MPNPKRGEVWLVDFGVQGKTRPALVVSVAFGDRDRALITVVPHTTSLRGSPFEIAVEAPFLKPGAFLVQGVAIRKSVLKACYAGWGIPRDGLDMRAV
jgi:mRNA interferase MazF